MRRLKIYSGAELVAVFFCTERAADKAAQVLNLRNITWKLI